MTAEERVESLHARMDSMRKARERRKTGLIGAAGAVLTACLAWLIFAGGTAHGGGSADLYSGATMLFENAGGYVLAAIIAFMAGVVITAAAIRKKKNETKRFDEKTVSAEHSEEEDHERENTDG